MVPRTKRERVRSFSAGARSAVDLISERPATGAPYLVNTRRVLLRRFPFFVVYRVRGDDVQIVAVAHARRRPGYWRGR
ncbi:MAG: type II toxin-antitoxin system RelE/ParE family toxin [Vicinamibacterales bacterium]